MHGSVRRDLRGYGTASPGERQREFCACIQDALWRMDDRKLSVEQLTALSRAVPEEQERRDLGLFLRVCLVPVRL